MPIIVLFCNRCGQGSLPASQTCPHGHAYQLASRLVVDEGVCDVGGMVTIGRPRPEVARSCIDGLRGAIVLVHDDHGALLVCLVPWTVPLCYLQHLQRLMHRSIPTTSISSNCEV